MQKVSIIMLHKCIRKINKVQKDVERKTEGYSCTIYLITLKEFIETSNKVMESDFYLQ